MQLIVLGGVLLLAGVFLIFRLRKSAANDELLALRLHQAKQLYEAIRHERDNERWQINKARNDVYFRRLDVRLKSWNPLVRKLMYLIAGVMVVYGIEMLAFAFA